MNPRLTALAKIGVKKLLRRAGHSLNCSTYLHKYCFGYHLAELFRRLNIQCVLDVGANIGGYRNFLRHEVGYRGLILSFEPVRRHVEALQAQARNDPAWVIYDFALGAEVGQKQINVMRGNVFTSFLAPDHSVVSDFSDWNIVERQESVRVETLDSIMGDLSAKHLLQATYLKIDTQGFDLEVIKGARATLPQMAALQTEVSLRPLYRGMPGFVEVYSQLVDLGFDLTGMYPVTRDSSLRLIEQDCVMINRRFISATIGNPTGGAIPHD